MSRGGTRGSGLALALVAILIMGLLSAAVYTMTKAMVKECLYQQRLGEAQAIAEAGLEDALLQLRLNPKWKTGFTDKPFAGGSYTVTVSTDIINPWVTSIGYSANIPTLKGPAGRTVIAQSLLQSGFMFAADTFTVLGNGLVDSYDSTKKKNPASFDANAQVWSNGQVVTSVGGIRIRGNVSYITPPAPAGSTVEGTITLEDSPRTVTVEDPGVYISTAVNDNNNCCTPQSAYNAVTMIVTVSTNNPVTLKPGIYYFKGMNIYDRLNVNTNFKNGQTAKVYLAGNLYVGGNKGEINVKDDLPAGFIIYGQGGKTIDLSSRRGPAKMDIESPQDTVRVNQEYYGAILGKTVTITAGNSVHADVSIISNTETQGSRWISGTWSANYRK